MQLRYTQPNIIQEDDDVIVCHKPAGIATQTRSIGQQDMESLLRNYRAKKGEDPYIGIVHRLDQPVEGIMVFAKNPKAAACLSEQVKSRIIGKHYYAVVYVQDRVADGGTLTDYLLFDAKKNFSAVVPPEEKDRGRGAKKPQKAVLDYEVRARRDKRALLDITLHTGRHHQIRVQLANMGCPILGDLKYGNGQNRTKSGLALCSYRLEFEHPSTGERIDISIEPENSKIRDLKEDYKGAPDLLRS